jgi:ketosteroid isomerase-like protein
VLTVNGKYVTVFQKPADGGWKAVADIFNEDAPAAPAKK